MRLKAKNIRYFSFVVAVILALPLPLGIFTGFYIWLSPYVFLNSFLAKTGFTLFNLLGIIFLFLAVYRHRWICRYACPMGVICDTSSKFSKKKKGKFPSLNKSILILALLISLFGLPILSVLDPFYIFNNFFEVLSPEIALLVFLKISGLIVVILLNVIFPHSWCTKICPLGGLQEIVTDIKKSVIHPKKTDQKGMILSRRFLISGLAGLGLGLAFRKLISVPKIKKFRPPGALAEEDFTTTCIRCGNCIKACPTKIIQLSVETSNPFLFLAPEIGFDKSYCLPECTLCGDVCPSNAISKFNFEKKKELFIGTAKINLKNCLLTQNKECDQCKFYCAYNAVQINSKNIKSFPEIDAEKCVGCGACKIVCPEQVIE
ncbi:MAG: 4Fe-4S dicluster domain-containing protein, partial [Prolixibacteraceae bacterium]|nr:4Fe-4S dicluster domain-containing protein [Prolixibacteraceae bacterium]